MFSPGYHRFGCSLFQHALVAVLLASHGLADDSLTPPLAKALTLSARQRCNLRAATARDAATKLPRDPAKPRRHDEAVPVKRGVRGILLRGFPSDATLPTRRWLNAALGEPRRSLTPTPTSSCSRFLWFRTNGNGVLVRIKGMTVTARSEIETAF